MGQTKSIRAFIREQLKERRLRRSDFDALLGQRARYTDNALNHTRQMGADVAIAILAEIQARYRVAAAGALLEVVRRRVRGADVPLPMNVPADTVAPLAAAFERFTIAQGGSVREASVAATGLRNFLDETRVAGAGALRLELMSRAREGEWTIRGKVIDPDDFDRALQLANHLTGNTRAVPPKAKK